MMKSGVNFCKTGGWFTNSEVMKNAEGVFVEVASFLPPDPHRKGEGEEKKDKK